jgi:hypothetical protein
MNVLYQQNPILSKQFNYFDEKKPLERGEEGKRKVLSSPALISASIEQLAEKNHCWFGGKNEILVVLTREGEELFEGSAHRVEASVKVLDRIGSSHG